MNDEKPPIMGTWANLYLFVLAFNLGLVLLFIFLSHYFS